MIKKNLSISIYILIIIFFSLNTYSDEENRDETLFKSLVTNAVKISAHITINTAELIASEAAEKELNKFRKGEHDGSPVVYSELSSETRELFEGAYYKQLNEHLMNELIQWYGGEIPGNNGLFSQSQTYRIFDTGDFIWGITDGIDLADVIGSITYYVRASTKDGVIHFEGLNKMSLSSYSGQNYLRHDLVNNPHAGAFKTAVQVFRWQVAIPLEFRK